MGLGTSPVIWMTYIIFLLDSMPDKEKVIAIMDDLLIHSPRRKHFELIENLLITLSHSCKRYVNITLFYGILYVIFDVISIL